MGLISFLKNKFGKKKEPENPDEVSYKETKTKSSK